MADSGGGKECRYYVRFTLNQRLQHLVLALCVSMLIVTGFPLRYAASHTSATLVHLLGGYQLRGAIHRLAAAGLILLGLYHVGYILFTPRGRSEFRALLPSRHDLSEFAAMMRYYFSRERERPAVGRFSYIEKFEYWAVVWGVIVMAFSGVVLGFSQWLLFLPRWVLDVARVVHSYEALLAFLSIVIWHFYNVHLGPSVFPLSWTWIDGLVEEDRLAREHPLEYAVVREDPTRWVRGPSRWRARVPLAAPTKQQEQPFRVGAVVLATIGGVIVGVVTPVFLSPCLALTIWLLNPEANPWGAALLAVSLVLVPAAVLGGCLATALALSGFASRSCVYMTGTGLLGLFLGVMSIWVPFAAGVYVLRWFLPIPVVARSLLIAAIILSLGGGLLGSILGVLHGRSLRFGLPLGGRRDSDHDACKDGQDE